MHTTNCLPITHSVYEVKIKFAGLQTSLLNLIYFNLYFIGFLAIDFNKTNLDIKYKSLY